MPWVGGKNRLCQQIAEYIPSEVFDTWCEPFGGAGSMLFCKPKWGKREIYNDLDNRLYTLFKVVKYHHDEFYRQFRDSVCNDQEYYDWKYFVPQTDIQKAARFFYLIRCSFGGKGEVPAHRGCDKRPVLCSDISKISDRIRRVVIEGMDYAEIFDRYDSPDTFFNLDPPYDGSNFRYYTEKNKGAFDQELFRDKVRNLKGRWIMSNADTPNIRKLWNGYSQVAFTRKLQVNNYCEIGREKVFNEILVANYNLEGIKSDTPLLD